MIRPASIYYYEGYDPYGYSTYDDKYKYKNKCTNISLALIGINEEQNQRANKSSLLGNNDIHLVYGSIESE